MNDVLALAKVRVNSQYFPVWDCIPYSCARKRLWLSLWLGLAVSIFSLGLYIVQNARRTSWLSLELGLAVSIFSLGLCIIQLRNKEIVALVMVRVSSQYFPVLDCILYSTQEGLHGSR